MRILNHDDVREALTGREQAVLDAVREAYVLHGEGRSQVPFSTFLRPPQPTGSRIIALPAHLSGPEPLTGLKWISSYPGNVVRGAQRASAVQILNDPRTGYPVAVLEGSQVSAARTAASAAVASSALHADAEAVRTAGLVGCGTINHAVVAYLRLVHPGLERVTLHDAVPGRAEVAAAALAQLYPGVAFVPAPLAEVLRAETVSIATTDSTYWLDLAEHPDRPARQVILHLSLRDLSTASVRDAFNVVDDAAHAVREGTSLDRAAAEAGATAVVQAELPEVLARGVTVPDGVPVVFSPFGLGILDLAVAALALDVADRTGLGTEVAGFEPGDHPVTKAGAAA